MDNIELLTGTLDDKQIAYTNQTNFLVQVGKGKSEYKTRYCITGNLVQAVMYYNGINIGNGYKKRLVAPTLKPSVLAKLTSL